MVEPNAKVFIRDQSYAWIPGSVVFVKDGQAFVRVELPNDWHSTTALCQDSGLEELEDALMEDGEKKPNAFRAVPLAQYPNQQLPLQNTCGSKSDMVDLPQLHEAAMLYNLKERVSSGKPYTRVGDIIVAVNPFERDQKLYDQETQQLYADKHVWNVVQGHEAEEKKDDGVATAIGDSELEPHVYEISSQAFRSLALDKRDQTILVLGESGSGKTETVKIVLEHLTTLGGGRSSSMARGGDDVVKKVLQSSIVFEAFGNAKTQHNINSSRFGKYTQLQFAEDAADTTASTGPACHSLVGSVCTIYLLEKSRVASRSGAERNFHIFYQLLCAPEDFRRDMWPFFAACKVEDFKFLANSMGSSNRDDIRRDTASWTQTLQALEAFHIKGSLFKMLMEAVAIVLQLGNIQFSSERSPKGVVQTIISSTTELDILSEMTGIERKDLEIMLTTRSVKTNFEDIRSPQDPDAAKEAVDSLAKEIYARIFESITRQVNEQSKSSLPADALGGIGILDFYGFERLEVNQFEQLCINYANEQLQQKYVADNFRILKTEYDEEGIDIFDFSLVDNSSVLHLLDGRNGVFVKLLEECMKPNGSAESFISKIKESNNSSDRLIVHKHFKRKEFCINHFAGPCTYNASTFVNRNMDKLPEELMTCFSKTTNNVIRKELLYVIQKQPQAGGKKRKQKANGTLLEKFSFELRDLLVTIESTDARYIRCIVPNGTRSPRVTNHLMTLRQLESAGLMTAVALSRESFPDSLSYNTLLSRFKCLMTRKDQQNLKQMAVPDQIVYMLTNLFMSMFDEEDANLASMPFACGTSKAYLRAGALEHLEYLRFRFLSNQAVIIQRLGRKKRAERVYSRQREAVTKIQAVARSFILRHRFMEKRQASIKLASWFLQRKPERESITLRRGNAAGKIQYVWQSMNQQRNYHQARVAAIITFRSKRRAATGLKKDDELEDDISTLLGRIALRRGALPSDRFPEQSLLAEIETTLRELGHERHFLMRQANDKKAKARPQKNEEVEIDDIKVKPQGYSTEGRHEDIIEWERPGSKKQQGNPMINKLIDLQNKVSSSREKLGTLRCENNSLIRERDRWKQQASELETAANKLKTAYEKKMKCLELKVSRSEKEKDTIASDLNRTMKQEQRGLRDENERLSKMLKDAEQKHHDDTEALRDDLLSSQRIEQQLRSKVSQIQRDHAEEIESVKVDRDASIAKKDAEIARLEEKVTKLEKTNLEEKEVYQNMLSEAEQLHEKDIQTLQTELNRAQEKERELEEELNELQTAHAEELEKRMTKTLDYDSKQNEIAKLQKTLQEQEEKSEKEKEELRTQLRKAEEKHEQELSRMKEEVFWAQESQRQLKSELSELQTVHAEEIESVKQEAAQKPDGAPITDEKTKEMREQLEQQEAAFREEKEELCKMLREADDKYRCEIDGLKEEIREAQGANEQLRFELTKSQTAHAEEVETLTMDLVDSHEKDLEISQLKETIQEQEESFEREKEELHERLKEHLDEVRALKEDFVETQNAHMFHLHCILDMLEDMDADREKNMAELLNELDAIQLAKDSKIQELESELFFQRSRQQHSPDLSTIEEDVESNLDSTSTSTNSELNLARQAIEEHAAERLKRSDEFNTTLKNLQLAVKPENMKYIFEKLQKQHYYNSGAEMKVFSEIHRMTKVLGELYANEERSQDEIDKNTMVLLDRFLTTSSSSGYSSRC